MKAQFSSGSTLISLAAGETKIVVPAGVGIVRRMKLTNTGDYPVWVSVDEKVTWFYLEAKTEYPLNFPEEPMTMPNIYMKSFDNATTASGLAAYAY